MHPSQKDTVKQKPTRHVDFTAQFDVCVMFEALFVSHGIKWVYLKKNQLTRLGRDLDPLRSGPPTAA